MRCLSCLTWTVSNGTVLGPRFPELFFGLTSTFPPDLRNFARFSLKKNLNMKILFSLYDAQDAHFRVWDTATCVDCVWHSNSCWQNNNFISDVLKTMRTFKTSELLLLWSLRCTHCLRIYPDHATHHLIWCWDNCQRLDLSWLYWQMSPYCISCCKTQFSLQSLLSVVITFSISIISAQQFRRNCWSFVSLVIFQHVQFDISEDDCLTGLDRYWLGVMQFNIANAQVFTTLLICTCWQ